MDRNGSTSSTPRSENPELEHPAENVIRIPRQLEVVGGSIANMPVLPKLKEGIDWARRIHFLFWIAVPLLSSSMGTAIWKVVPGVGILYDWRIPISLFAAGIVFLLLALLDYRLKTRSEAKYGVGAVQTSPVQPMTSAQSTVISPPTASANIKFVNLKYSGLKFPDHMTPAFPSTSGVKGVIAFFRNETIVHVSPPSFLEAKAHTRFFDNQGIELVSIDTAPWFGGGMHTRTLDVGTTAGVVLAISGDGNQQFARNVVRTPAGFSWSPGDTFGFSDTPIPSQAARAEIVLIDQYGVSTKPFRFTIVEEWLFDPDNDDIA
jgi:hypothetical protein